MKRGLIIFLLSAALGVSTYFALSEWAISHQAITFYDASRDNPVDVAVRFDKEMQANAELIKLPVAVLNHGNTVKNTEYSFLANVFAARGYLVLSPQHDLPTDPPMVTKPGELYAGRLTQIERGVANIRFVLNEMRKQQPNADYTKITIVGHSMGGDIAMYFATRYPNEVRRVVTLDNLRVPFARNGKFKILSFRSHDPQFKTDQGVLPNEEEAKRAGITIVQTEYQHNFMRDTGPDEAKAAIQEMLQHFLSDADAEPPGQG